ncbi:MAG: Ribosome recycling factor, partial [uncultured Solirubrobacteraceae bacterium]
DHDRRPARRRAGVHVEVRGRDPPEVRLRAHRPRQPGAARPHHGRLLRRADAAQAARDGQRARGADADHPAVRQVLDQGDREVHPRVRRGAHPVQRRPADPADHPRAQRGAAQAARQGGARDRGGGPDLDPQPPPRHDVGPARAARRRRGRAGRRAPRRGGAPEADHREGGRARRHPQGQRGRDPRGV